MQNEDAPKAESLENDCKQGILIESTLEITFVIFFGTLMIRSVKNGFDFSKEIEAMP